MSKCCFINVKSKHEERLIFDRLFVRVFLRLYIYIYIYIYRKFQTFQTFQNSATYSDWPREIINEYSITSFTVKNNGQNQLV